MLCTSKRFPLAGLPSTCTLDTALVPLPSFLFLAALAVYYLTKHWRRSIQPDAETTKYNPLVPRQSPILARWLYNTYLFLGSLSFWFAVREIVRMADEDLGVGLLPVPIIALFVASLDLWRERGRCYHRGGILAGLRKDSLELGEYWQRKDSLQFSALFLGYWIFYCALQIVKTVRLHELDQVHPGTVSKYPAFDMFSDNVVMAGLHAVLTCLEGAITVRIWLRSRSEDSTTTRSCA